MKKYILPVVAACMAAAAYCPAHAQDAPDGIWRVHNTFDYSFKETIDTPSKVYVLALGQMPYNDPSWGYWYGDKGQLFVIDKASDKIFGLNNTDGLSGDVILDIAYNPQKKYLLIIYDNFNIDIRFDSGEVHNIPNLINATLGASKKINNVTFDPQRNKVYLAADYGFATLDDEFFKLDKTFVYNKKLNGVARVGDYIIAGTDEGVYKASATSRNPGFDSFTKVSDGSLTVSSILPLSENMFAYISTSGLYLAKVAADGSISSELKDKNTNIEYYTDNRDGYFLRRWGCTYQLDREGNLTDRYITNTGQEASMCGSWDMTYFYCPVIRKGVEKLTYNRGWSEDRPMYTPDAPSCYGIFDIDFSSKAGAVVSNNTFNRFYNAIAMNYRNLMSSYNNNTWTTKNSCDSPTAIVNNLRSTYGVVIDPIDDKYGWVGSIENGLVRINLTDMTAEMYAHPDNGNRNGKGFHTVFPKSPYWAVRCNVSSPSFDADGNLWCVFNPSHAYEKNPVYCWPAEARRNNDVSAFKVVPTPGYIDHYESLICTATKSEASRGFLIFAANTRMFEHFHLLYHGGTVTDTSDDKLLNFNALYDQDNTQLPYTYINKFVEDPSTDDMWILTDAGAYFFKPSEALAAGDQGGRLNVTRPRLDSGDYLLYKQDVTAMTFDSKGRKWFATAGGGVVVTSPDCRKVLKVFNTANSPLPTDIIFGLGYDPSANAMWVGTSEQICTLYLDAEPQSQDYKSVIASPNPVRPDYQGHVSIQGLHKKAPVKIMDASGKEVRHLGTTGTGNAVWDLKDSSGNTVPSGAYYIVNSTEPYTPGQGTRINVLR